MNCKSDDMVSLTMFVFSASASSSRNASTLSPKLPLMALSPTLPPCVWWLWLHICDMSKQYLGKQVCAGVNDYVVRMVPTENDRRIGVIVTASSDDTTIRITKTQHLQHNVRIEKHSLPDTISGSYLVSIDVECAAVGHGHFDLVPVRIAMVDCAGKLLFERVTNPCVGTMRIVDPLIEFTGLTTKEIVKGQHLQIALGELRIMLSELNRRYHSGVIIVGQSVAMDIIWCQLRKHEHYADVIDIGHMFKSSSCMYSLRMEASVLLDTKDKEMNSEFHDPVEDAQTAMMLYRKVADSKDAASALRRAKEKLNAVFSNGCRPNFKIIPKFKMCPGMLSQSDC